MYGDDFDDFDDDDDDLEGDDSGDDDAVSTLQMLHDTIAGHAGVYCNPDNVSTCRAAD